MPALDQQAYIRDQERGDFNELKRICIAHEDGVEKVRGWLNHIEEELADIPLHLRPLYVSIDGSAPK